MSFTERIEQRGDSSVPQCSPIVRLRMIYFTLCFVAIGCLDADQGSVVVKPRRAKGSAVSSSESSSPRKTKSSCKADSDRDEKVLNHPELQAELAQVDDLIRTVGGDDAAVTNDRILQECLGVHHNAAAQNAIRHRRTETSLSEQFWKAPERRTLPRW